MFVHRSSYKRLVDTLLPRIKSLRVGTDVGSLISSTPISKLESLIAESVEQGATVLTGGKRFDHPKYPGASYFEPTLIVDVKMNHAVAQNELFAPVMSVVVYDDVDEAVGWLNASRFGHGAGVYGENKRECKRVAGLLECGMVAINE